MAEGANTDHAELNRFEPPLIPLAATFAVVPIVNMGFYLWGAKRMGAFDAL